jgi:outer membrane protein TolC
MKKSGLVLLGIFVFQIHLIKAQEAVSLQDCYQDALLSHPFAREKEIQKKLWEIRDQNIATAWYPEINAGANFLYNTNIADLSDALDAIPVPGISDNIGSMPHDQYKFTIDLSQVIWDGGATKNRRELEVLGLQLSEQEIETELYKVREKVNNTFFGLILLKRQKELLNNYLDLFKNRISSMESAINNGMMLPGDKNSILAEQLKLKQQLTETEIKISALCEILSDLTGKIIIPETELLLPDISPERDPEIKRPELLGLDFRIKQLEAGKSLIKSNRMPKAFGFATLGYGSPPGNNFFTDEFGSYAVVGAGISWEILDWNNSKREKQKIDLNKTLIGNRKSDLEDNINRALLNKYSEIQAYKAMLESDRELISLRKSISSTSESQFNNGSITSTEYLSVLNLEKEAILSQNIHQVNLIKSQVEYLNISGNEIK